jgi:hypothetical protein
MMIARRSQSSLSCSLSCCLSNACSIGFLVSPAVRTSRSRVLLTGYSSLCHCNRLWFLSLLLFQFFQTKTNVTKYGIARPKIISQKKSLSLGRKSGSPSETCYHSRVAIVFEAAITDHRSNEG